MNDSMMNSVVTVATAIVGVAILAVLVSRNSNTSGVIGAAAVGSAIAADGYYYDGYRRCGWVRQYDAFGNYVGRVRVCD